MKLNKYIFLSFVLAFAFSCTDEDKFNNEVFFELERGGYVRFADDFDPLIGATSADSWTYDATIEDVNGNLSSYDLFIIADVDAVAGDDTTLVKSFTNISSGPTSIALTAAEVATALNQATTDFNFGDAFDFIATATRTDGTVFRIDPLEVDFEEGTVSGNTQENLVNEPGYRTAMNFRLIIACPEPPNVANYAGTYVFLSNGWLGTTDGTVQIEVGPGDNQITLRSAQTRRGATGDIDFIIDINEDQTVTAANQPGYEHPTFGPTTLGSGAGFTFECANGFITIRMSQTVAAGSFGGATTVLERQ